MSEGPQDPRRPRPPERPPPPTGMLQAGGVVASDIIGGLKQQPVMLLLLILNIAFLTLVHLGVSATGERHHKEMTQLLDKCFAPDNRRP